MDGNSLHLWNKAKTQILKVPLGLYCRSEISKHSCLSDAWLILFGKVYNITEFLRFHPGGVQILLPFLGKDGSEAFSI